MSSKVHIGLLCAALAIGVEELRAEDWSGWRGADRSGVSDETDVPIHWSATEGIRWKAEVPGSGISSPIVWGDRIFITASDGPQQSDLHILCLGRDDGKEQWHLRLWGSAPTRYHATKSSMASPTPVTDGQRVVAFFGTGDVICTDSECGLLWHRSLAGEYGRFENRFAATSSPILFEDLVIVQCDHYGDSYVIAIDVQSGRNRWKIDRPETWLSWSSPVLVPAEKLGQTELVLCAAEKIDAFDPRTGEFLWTVPGMQRECIPTPVFGGGVLFAVSGPGGPSMAIKPGGRGNVSESHVLWRNTRGAPFVPSAILVGDCYYLVDDKGIATCLDAQTGERVWQKRLGGAFTASPVATAEHVYFTDEKGTTVVIDAGEREYHEIARNSLAESVFASPAISQGHLLIRSARNLYSIHGSKEPVAKGATP